MFNEDAFIEKLADTYGDPNAFSELVFGTPLNHAQLRYVLEHNGQVNFLLPGNSAGKTELICRYALYLAWHKIGPQRPDNVKDWYNQRYQGLVASFNYAVAEESFKRLSDYRDSREEVAALITGVHNSKSEITLSNKSTIKWGSLDDKGKLVEAKRCNFIFVDEVGHIPQLSFTFDSVLYPRTMGVAGIIHLFGTPKPNSDPFLLEIAEKGRGGGDGYYFSQAGTVFENQFWPEGEKERVLRNPRYVRGWTKCDGCEDTMCFTALGGHPLLTPLGRQVFLGHFVLEGGLFFNRFAVQRVFNYEGEDPEWLGEDFFAFPPEPGHLYTGFFDLAGNKLKRHGTKTAGSDPTVGIIIDHTEKPWKIVYYNFIRGGSADWETKYQVMEQASRAYSLWYLNVDATGNMDSVVEALEKRGIQVNGVVLTPSLKIDELRNLQLVMELEWGIGQQGVLKSPLIPKLKFELEHYHLPDDNIEQDCVMALAGACHDIVQNDLPAGTAAILY